jgi:ABC-2 type transport system ATP-binding protein
MEPEPIVRIKGLTVRYGSFVAVDGLDLELRRGELFGLLGPNGAGKSSTLRVLIGQRRPSGGRVTVAARDVVREWAAIKPLFGYVPDRENHFEEFTGRRNLQIFGGLYGVPPSRIDECLKLVELDEAADLPVRGYSLGMRRKLLLARALLHRPPILYLDEPTANLDIHSAAVVRRTLRDLVAAGGTVLLTTHNMAEVEEVCDRVAILCRGRLVALDTPMALRQQHTERKVDVVLANGGRSVFDLDRAEERAALAGHIAAGAVESLQTREFNFHETFLKRHMANRGGIALGLLLVVMAVLLSFFGKDSSPAAGLTGGVQACYVDYWDEDSGWVRHLEQNVPAELKGRVEFRPPRRIRVDRQGQIYYPPGVAAIQIRTLPEGNGPRYMVWLWHPDADGTGLAPFEAWFWKETANYFLDQVGPSARTAARVPDLVVERSQLHGGALDLRSSIASALVIFALFFVCVYLLPSLTCEERERGVLLAQALSPASPLEILAAKFVFYPVLAVGLAAVLAGIYRPAALGTLFFWLAIGVSAFGSLGIGLTIASIARTQRAASMGALCYMLSVALFLFICQQNNIWGLSHLALEYHCPRMIQAILSDSQQWYHWGNLLGAALLSLIWGAAATVLFRQRGWQ